MGALSKCLLAMSEYIFTREIINCHKVAIEIEVVPGRYGRQGKTRVCSRTQNSTFCTNFDEILEAVRPRNEVLPQGNADVPSRTTAGGF